VSVDRAEVDRLARLAHLHFEGDEADRLGAEMTRILAYASRLREEGPADDGEDARQPAPPTSADAYPADEGLSGGRAATEAPDPLLAPLESIAPRYAEGFFVVPPPPGVSPRPGAEGSGASLDPVPGED